MGEGSQEMEEDPKIEAALQTQNIMYYRVDCCWGIMGKYLLYNDGGYQMRRELGEGWRRQKGNGGGVAGDREGSEDTKKMYVRVDCYWGTMMEVSRVRRGFWGSVKKVHVKIYQTIHRLECIGVKSTLIMVIICWCVCPQLGSVLIRWVHS